MSGSGPANVGRISTKALTVSLAGLGVAAVVISLLTAYVRRHRRQKARPRGGTREGGSAQVDSLVGCDDRADGIPSKGCGEGVASGGSVSNSDGLDSYASAGLSASSSTVVGGPLHSFAANDGSASGHVISPTANSNASDPAGHCGHPSEGQGSQLRSPEPPTAEMLSLCSAGQLCNLGLDHLNHAIRLWQEAEARVQTGATLGDSSEAVCEAPLKELVERSQMLLSRYHAGVEREVITDASTEALLQLNQEYEEKRQLRDMRSIASITSCSSFDSFVSALEVPDLSDLEDELDALHVRGTAKQGGATRDREVPPASIYEQGLLMLRADDESITVRKLRTSIVGCSSDSEFLSKVYCLRMALDRILSSPTNRDWMLESGSSLLCDVLRHAGKDPSGFMEEMSNLMDFLNSDVGWAAATEELMGSRGVKAMNFYDILLDFILMDSFDDLANPPSSVTSITANRWISNGLKETALSTAVWSVLKAKAKMLKNQSGFLSHFYAVSLQVSPTLAWGFMGPDSSLKSICGLFKDEVMHFVRDSFNTASEWTSVDDLGRTVLALARQRVENVRTAIQAQPQLL